MDSEPSHDGPEVWGPDVSLFVLGQSAADHVAVNKNQWQFLTRDFVANAIENATCPTLIIADANVKFTPNDREWISKQVNDTTVQTYYYPCSGRSWIKRISLAMLRALVWLMFRTKKTELDPGITVIARSMARGLVEKISSSQSNAATNCSHRKFGAAELVAFAKLNQIPVEETSLERLTLSHCQPDASASESFPSIGTHSLARRAEIEAMAVKEMLQAAGRAVKFWWHVMMFPQSAENSVAITDRPRLKWRLAAWSSLVLATVAILFSNLGFPLFEPDEARNAQLAINALDSGDWLSLQLAGQPYWDKPPLQIWAIATSYKLLGISAATTRLPGVLATLLTICCVFAMGKKLIGYRAAWLGAVLLLLSAGFLVIGRYVTMDASLTCCVTIMTLSFFLVAAGDPHRRFWMLLAGIVTGIGLLVKGPVMIVVGLPPALVALWLSGKLQTLSLRSWSPFVIPAVAIPAPWFIATSWVHPDFVTYFFWKHHVVRFSEAFNHREPFWYYLPVLLLLMFPASYLLPSVIKFVSSRDAAHRNLRSPSHGYLFLTAVWVVGFFSLSDSKLPTYILASVPPLCLLMGSVLDAKVFAAVKNGWSSGQVGAIKKTYLEAIPFRVPFELLLVILALSIVVVCSFGGQVPVVLIACTVAIGLFFAVWFSRQSPTGFRKDSQRVLVRHPRQSEKIAGTGLETHPTRPAIHWSLVGILALVVVQISVNQVAPLVAQSRSTHFGIQQLQDQSVTPLPLVFFGREDYGTRLLFPSQDVHFFKMNEADRVATFLTQNPNSMIVSSRPQMENLRRMLNWQVDLRTSATRHLYLSSRIESGPNVDQTQLTGALTDGTRVAGDAHNGLDRKNFSADYPRVKDSRLDTRFR